MYGLTPAQVQQLQVVADYSNPAGNLSWVEYEQRVNGIPMFQGYLRAALTNDGRIWRTMSNLAPGLDYTRLPASATPFAHRGCRRRRKTDRRKPHLVRSANPVGRSTGASDHPFAGTVHRGNQSRPLLFLHRARSGYPRLLNGSLGTA